MNLILTPLESEILLACDETRLLASALLIDDGNGVLFGTEDQFDELRNAVSDVLQCVGFDENY